MGLKALISKGLLVGMLGLGLAACAGDTGRLSKTAAGSSAAPGTVEDFTLNVGDRVFFETDQTSLTSTARSTLQRQAVWLKNYRAVKVRVEGHADERGTREYNIALGARRASATRSYLISLGVSSSRIRVNSYGKERPVATCDNISCWSQNRRAVTSVTGAVSS